MDCLANSRGTAWLISFFDWFGLRLGGEGGEEDGFVFAYLFVLGVWKAFYHGFCWTWGCKTACLNGSFGGFLTFFFFSINQAIKFCECLIFIRFSWIS